MTLSPYKLGNWEKVDSIILKSRSKASNQSNWEYKMCNETLGECKWWHGRGRGSQSSPHFAPLIEVFNLNTVLKHNTWRRRYNTVAQFEIWYKPQPLILLQVWMRLKMALSQVPRSWILCIYHIINVKIEELCQLVTGAGWAADLSDHHFDAK